MSSAPRHPLSLQPVRCVVHGMDAVRVSRDLRYGSAGEHALTLDLYQPAHRSPAPVMVLATGYPDVGVRRPLGCAFKDMAMWTSLARIFAASGVAAVGYTSACPAQDIDSVLSYLGEHATALGVDPGRAGLWATSGHVPTALGALARLGRRAIKAAVLSTGYTLDLVGSAVADAGRRYGFAVPDLSMDDLPADVPVFIARAGRDENPGLNDALDRFTAEALSRNWPLTLVNHGTASHAFELTDDGSVVTHAIEQMIAFARFWLQAPPA